MSEDSVDTEKVFNFVVLWRTGLNSVPRSVSGVSSKTTGRIQLEKGTIQRNSTRRNSNEENCEWERKKLHGREWHRG